MSDVSSIGIQEFVVAYRFLGICMRFVEVFCEIDITIVVSECAYRNVETGVELKLAKSTKDDSRPQFDETVHEHPPAVL